MLHAPTSEAKTESSQSKSQLAVLPERELHPHAFGVAGAYSFPGAASVASIRSPQAQQRHNLSGMQRTQGNQAVWCTLNSAQYIASMLILRPSQSIMLQRQCACGGSAETQGEFAECTATSE